MDDIAWVDVTNDVHEVADTWATSESLNIALKVFSTRRRGLVHIMCSLLIDVLSYTHLVSNTHAVGALHHIVESIYVIFHHMSGSKSM